MDEFLNKNKVGLPEIQQAVFRHISAGSEA